MIVPSASIEPHNAGERDTWVAEIERLAMGRQEPMSDAGLMTAIHDDVRGRTSAGKCGAHIT